MIAITHKDANAIQMTAEVVRAANQSLSNPGLSESMRRWYELERVAALRTLGKLGVILVEEKPWEDVENVATLEEVEGR